MTAVTRGLLVYGSRMKPEASNMERRHFVLGCAALLALSGLAGRGPRARADGNVIERLRLSDAEWRRRLSPERYEILRLEGTEAPFSSPLNDEKRPGRYLCAGCGLPLFDASMKFDSGTGWPSFFTAFEDHVETRTDFRLIYPRTEYHCARCGGHQGHVFEDGPEPTGQRWCNNGLALTFEPAGT